MMIKFMLFGFFILASIAVIKWMLFALKKADVEAKMENIEHTGKTADDIVKFNKKHKKGEVAKDEKTVDEFLKKE